MSNRFLEADMSYYGLPEDRRRRDPLMTGIPVPSPVHVPPEDIALEPLPVRLLCALRQTWLVVGVIVGYLIGPPLLLAAVNKGSATHGGATFTHVWWLVLIGTAVMAAATGCLWLPARMVFAQKAVPYLLMSLPLLLCVKIMWWGAPALPMHFDCYRAGNKYLPACGDENYFWWRALFCLPFLIGYGTFFMLALKERLPKFWAGIGVAAIVIFALSGFVPGDAHKHVGPSPVVTVVTSTPPSPR
jgi:hypothetical protein